MSQVGNAIATQVEHFRNVARKTMLVASGNAQSAWFNLRGLRPFTVTATGDFVGDVKFYVSNEDQEPDADLTKYPQLDMTYTTPCFLQFDSPVWWLCVEFSNYSSGDIRVEFLGG